MSRRMFFRNGKEIFELDGKEVTEKQFNKDWKTTPTNFAAGECPISRDDLGDFCQENSGKGRYIPQMAAHPKDPNAYFRTVGDVANEAKKRGMPIEEM